MRIGLNLSPQDEMQVPMLAVVAVIMSVTGYDMNRQFGVLVDGLAHFLVSVQHRSRSTPHAQAEHHPKQYPEESGELNGC